MKLCVSVLFAWFLSVTFVTCHPDEVTDLPGLSFKPNFKHYSGYLNASSGRYLHYWFVESENDPANDPLVLWMNGGPGCSSLDGFLTELGPFHVKKDGKTLYKNPYSWNKIANVVFLEAPAGVGFSYSDDGQYITDDIKTAKDNYLALQHFFVKFPQFKTNDFYITGESYGGIYVPTLSVLVLNGSADINFKGFAIGNGFLDSKKLGNSLVFFAYYHGLFGQKLLNELTKECCESGAFSPSTCHFSDSKSDTCLSMVEQVETIIHHSGLNVYNLYATCDPSALSTHSRAPFDRKLVTKSVNLTHHINNSYHDSPPCIDSRNITNWINQPTVRTALHIPTHIQDWSVCSEQVEMGYRNIYDSMKSQVLTLVQSGRVRGMIYNGDVDMACNFLGDQWFVDDLQLPLISTYREWKFGNQVAGFVKEFNQLTFVTIKGSGHMVPQDKPGPAFKMISNFLYQKPF